MNNRRNIIMLGAVMILSAAFLRVILYDFNIYFSPVIAMALFAGAVVKERKLAFALPLLAMFVSDVLFELLNIDAGFWGWSQLVNYAALVVITVLGFTLKKTSLFNVASYSIFSTLIFFLLSNAAVWALDTTTYANDFSGLVDSIAAGIPFLRNNLFADLFYCTVLFGGRALVEKYAISKKASA
jgi:hypothetical protein